jgi:hypothetical protein
LSRIFIEAVENQATDAFSDENSQMGSTKSKLEKTASKADRTPQPSLFHFGTASGWLHNSAEFY